MLSMTGLGTNTADPSKGFNVYDPRTSMDSQGNYLILYDSGGVPVCYWNGTAYNPADTTGVIVKSAYLNYANWYNGTACGLYYDTVATEQVNWADCTGVLGLGTSRINPTGDPLRDITFTSSLSWLVIIIAIMAIGTIAGIKILGSGESEISVDLLLKGTFYLTIWGILTVMAYPLILEGGFYIFIFYFGLALMYTIGIVNSVGHPSND